MDRIVLRDSLKMHLGIRTKSYINNDEQAYIGVNHKLNCRPLYVITIKHEEIEELLEEDINEAVKLGKQVFRNFNQYPSNVQNFIVELVFTYGEDVKKFKKGNKALKDRDCTLAKFHYKKELAEIGMYDLNINDLMKMLYDDSIKDDTDISIFNIEPLSFGR